MLQCCNWNDASHLLDTYKASLVALDSNVWPCLSLINYDFDPRGMLIFNWEDPIYPHFANTLIAISYIASRSELKVTRMIAIDALSHTLYDTSKASMTVLCSNLSLVWPCLRLVSYDFGPREDGLIQLAARAQPPFTMFDCIIPL